MSELVQARGLSCRYGAREALKGVDFGAGVGAVTAILGPNGAGKSTLLRALAGLVPYQGEVLLDGHSLARLERREIARSIALVAQDPPADAPFTVLELVLMGRAPHLGRFALAGAADLAIAEQAMRAADVLELSARPIDALSGGERRRAFLARALAQQPRVLLLDEPTAFLDLGHQAKVLEHAARLAREGLCVLAVLHDPNLAASFCERAVLLKDGSLVASGPAREVLRADALEALYGTRLVAATGPAGEGPFFASVKAPP